MTPTTDRFRRQQHAFADDARRRTAVVSLGGRANPLAARVLAAGAAAMGAAAIGSDFHDFAPPARHWILSDLPAMVARLHPDAAYGFLDPWAPALDWEGVVGGRTNAWAVVQMNDPAAARRALENLASARAGVGVILALAAPGGVLVMRCPGPEEALAHLSPTGGPPETVIPPGPADLAIMAGGLVLNEVMVAASRPDPLPRLAALYSLHRRRRVAADPEAGPGSLVAEIARPPEGGRASLAGRRLTMVGAGALGNWFALAAAFDGPDLAIFDGDPEVEASNANRQVLVVDGVGRGRPKVDCLVETLRAMDPTGRASYRGICQYVRTAGDLGDLASRDALVCVPDNDAARLVCGDAALEAGIPAAVGGTSAVGGQAVLCRPGRACLRCVTGLGGPAAPAPADEASASCSLTASDAVVASNAVVAGLLVSELREVFSGRPSANVRFVGDAPQGARLTRMLTDPPCPHAAKAMLSV